MCRIAIVAIISACFVFRSGVAAPLSFSKGSITAVGMTPAGAVVWFGATIASTGYEVRATRSAAVTLADTTGNASYSPPDTGPRSVWIAVDLTSGRYATGVPDGSVGTIKHLDTSSLVVSPRLQWRPIRAVTAEILVIRPGVGAWTLTASDGGRDDADGHFDGQISAAPAQFKSISITGAPPLAFLSSDLVVAIHPFELEMFIAGVRR
jgi:hypothetical protein